MLRPIRVLNVNHNRILREGISVLIGMQTDLELAGSAGDAEAGLRLYAETRPDLTLMDLDLPSKNGLDCIRRIRAIDPAAWVIALVTYEWDKCGHEAMEAGATTVLAKDLIGEMLLPLIHAGRHEGRGYEIPIVLELCGPKLR